MKFSHWTGGQYSLFRVLLGCYLFIHFSYLIPWGTEMFSSAGMLPDANNSPLIGVLPNLFQYFDSPVVVMAVLFSGSLAALFLMVGQYDRIAALFLWVILVWLLGRNPLISNPGIPYVGWLLLAHLFVPTKPFGAWSAQGRANPDGGWRLPEGVYISAWLILALSYSYSGYTKLLSPSWMSGDTISLVLQNPLARDTLLRDWLLTWPEWFFKGLTWSVLYIELLFLPLIFIKKLRFMMWFLMLMIQCGFLMLLNFADLTCGMLLIHLFTFDQNWFKAKPVTEKETLYYDGFCGLCHGTVRFLLAEDTLERYSYAPLQGELFERVKHDLALKNLPDSIVFITADRTVLTLSSAIIELLKGLGGLWMLVAWVLWVIPKPIRDFGYQVIGSIRLKVFGATEELCPMVDSQLRERFLM